MFRNTIFKISNLLRNTGINFDHGKNHAVLNMQRRINQLDAINFKIEIHPDGSWSAESVNLDGIITGGDNPKEINSIIKDAIFTYFEIPPYLCNDGLLKANNESVFVEQRVWATK